MNEKLAKALEEIHTRSDSRQNHKSASAKVRSVLHQDKSKERNIEKKLALIRR